MKNKFKVCFFFLGLIFFRLNYSINATPIIETYHYSIDSSTTRYFTPLAIPRNHIVPLSQAGHISIYMSNGFAASTKDWYVTYNLDSSVRFVSSLSSVSSPATHSHISAYNDTIYWYRCSSTDSLLRVLAMTGNSLTLQFSYNGFPVLETQVYAAPMWRLPNSDSVILVTRGSGTTNANNFRWSVSADGGRTWSALSTLMDWSTVSTPRIGMCYYNGTIAFAACSSSALGFQSSYVWWDFNRATHTFDRVGRAFDASGHVPWYRAISMAAYKDTTRFLVAMRHPTSLGIYKDTILYAYRNLNAGSWTEGVIISSEIGDTMPITPQASYEYIENSDRLILFYTANSSGVNSIDSVDVYMRYWIPESSSWSSATRITTLGSRTYLYDVCSVIPSSHGDVAYITYGMDTTISSTLWHFAMIAKVTFTEPTTGVRNYFRKVHLRKEDL